MKKDYLNLKDMKSLEIANPKGGQKPEAAAAASFLSHTKGACYSLVQGLCQ